MCDQYLTHFYISSLQYYLPPENLINKDFLKDVLIGKKQLKKKADVDQIEVPHYEELSVKALYPELKKDAEFMSYFPDKYPAGKAPPREYFFNILNTIHPVYLANVMDHASKQRHTIQGDAMKQESIKISEFWAEQLEQMPYLSCTYSNLSHTFFVLLWMDSKLSQHCLILFPIQRRTARPCIS